MYHDISRCDIVFSIVSRNAMDSSYILLKNDAEIAAHLKGWLRTNKRFVYLQPNTRYWLALRVNVLISCHRICTDSRRVSNQELFRFISAPSEQRIVSWLEQKGEKDLWSSIPKYVQKALLSLNTVFRAEQ